MKIKTKHIKGQVNNLLKILAEKSFITSLSLILLALALGGGLFYKYNILLDKQEPVPVEVSLKLKKQAYQDVLAEWKNMQDRFEKADFKNYLNPFEAR